MKHLKSISRFIAIFVAVIFGFSSCDDETDLSALDVLYTVTFNSNGGNNLEPIKVHKGTTITSLPVPSRNGFVFVGWYTDAELTKPFAAFSTIENDIVLFAKYDISIEIKALNLEVKTVDNVSYYVVKGFAETAKNTVESLNIPDEIYSEVQKKFLPVKEIAANAFWADGTLTHLHIGANVEIIGGMAFANIFGLKSVMFVSNSKLKNLPDKAFERCEMLTTVKLPDGIQRIGRRAFTGCESLITFTIPASVIAIGRDCFAGCKNLAQFYCYPVVPPDMRDAGDVAAKSGPDNAGGDRIFGDIGNNYTGIGGYTYQNAPSGNINVYVPASSLKAYTDEEYKKNGGTDPSFTPVYHIDGDNSLKQCLGGQWKFYANIGNLGGGAPGKVRYKTLP